MTTRHHGTRRTTTAADDAARVMWSSGDYAHIVRIMIADLGPALVRAAGIRAGDRVLDVAAGTGNATLPAARRGARVTALDLTPALLAVGEQQARAEGLEITWEEGTAEALPFGDGAFDVVLSCIGAMFAADHAATAEELLRVCRPGGTIAMANWTPGGAVGRFFGVLAAHGDPPPPGSPVPLSWGDPGYVRALLGQGCDRLRMHRRHVYTRYAGPPEGLVEQYRRFFGPVLTTYAALTDDPAGIAALDEALLGFARAEDAGEGARPGRYGFEYLEVVGRRSS